MLLCFPVVKRCFVSFFFFLDDKKAEVAGSDFKLPAPGEIPTWEINSFSLPCRRWG